jgi:hypothetical protein
MAAAAGDITGEELLRLIGKPEDAPEVQRFLKSLGEKDPVESSATAYVYPQKGIRIVFSPTRHIVLINLYTSRFFSRTTKFATYSGSLPYRLDFNKTRETVITTLGKPHKTVSTYFHYFEKMPVEMVLSFSTESIKAPLTGLTLKFKPCIEGDCVNGWGVWQNLEGDRYEGQWKGGKYHGEGSLYVAAKKVKQEGIWEEGVFKGRNYFSSQHLYDLLGKHQKSQEIEEIKQKNHQEYQKIKIAYDYTQYLFASKNFRLFFNDYGYLYKIELSRGGFQAFKHPVLEKIDGNTVDEHFIYHLLGSPQKETQHNMGKSWYYKDGKYDIRFNFDKNNYLEGVEIFLENEMASLAENKIAGECKKGDCVNGYGELVSVAGRYVGYFKNGKFEGKGIMHYANGGIYKGEFRANLRHGKGIYVWSDKSRYEGEWKDNLREGFGRMQYANQGRYEGYWHQNERSGQGSMYYPNGDRYSGQWYKNEASGKGILYQASGKIEAGTWKNGKKTN